MTGFTGGFGAGASRSSGGRSLVCSRMMLPMRSTILGDDGIVSKLGAGGGSSWVVAIDCGSAGCGLRSGLAGSAWLAGTTWLVGTTWPAGTTWLAGITLVSGGEFVSGFKPPLVGLEEVGDSSSEDSVKAIGRE